MALLAKNINSGNSYSGWTITLGADIDLGGHNWTPIGKTYNNRFQGTFDGDGHTISNLTITSSSNYVGLFGYVDTVSTVQNIMLTDVNVSGSYYVGGVVGYNGGTVSGCTVSGIFSGDDYVGGLVGSNGGTISDNITVATVNGSWGVGGITGYNGDNGKVSGNKFYSDKSAISYNNGTAENNTPYYKFTAPDGVNFTITGDDTLTVGETTYYVSGTTVTLTATNIPEGQFLKGTTLNDDGTYFYTMSNVAVEWAVPPTIDGMTFDMSIGAYKISTAADLQALATYVNNGNNCEGWTFKLAADIDLTGVNYTPIGTRYYNQYSYRYIERAFQGIFDGDGHTINKLTINSSSDNFGFFGYVGKGAMIQNVALTDINVKGNECIGGLVGWNNGGTVSNCTVSGKVNGSWGVGGIVGYNIEDGTVSGNTVISEVSGSSNVGALVGYNTATVSGNKFYSDKSAISYNNGTAENNTPYYKFTLPSDATAEFMSGDSITDGTNTYYASGTTLKLTAAGYTTTVTVDEDHTDFTDIINFGNGGKSVVVSSTDADFHENSGVYSITASQQNSTLKGNNNNNTVVLEGGGVNILTGGGGNDTYKFESGGGIVTDFGIGATKSSTGATLSAPLGSDIIKLGGTVSGVYFDRDASSKKSATFTAVVTYGTGDDTQIIMLKDINKKPTKYGSNPVYQTNDAAAATLKIWDTSGGSSKVLSATKLKKLFHDDSELSADLLSQVASLGKLDGIGDLNLPAVDQLNQNTQATYSGTK